MRVEKPELELHMLSFTDAHAGTGTDAGMTCTQTHTSCAAVRMHMQSLHVL